MRLHLRIWRTRAVKHRRDRQSLPTSVQFGMAPQVSVEFPFRESALTPILSEDIGADFRNFASPRLAIVIPLLRTFIQFMRPYFSPICSVAAWSLLVMLAWSLWSAVRDTVARSQQMHRIPCSTCQFFTRDYHLKCTVHPSRALTEEAIGCGDFEGTQNS
jgi:hypothetical protein